jgi:aryl-alcohol dehydrogenase-like predicted oxidoreductase
MPTRPFGRTGLQVPLLGFGAMQIGDPAIREDAASRLLHHVLDRGLTLIDTARSYGIAEERIGRHLAARRDEFVLSTKVGYGVPGVPDWTYECIVRGVDAARDRLRTDVIDIVHLHSCGLEILQAGEVTRALVRCVKRGIVRVAAYSGDGEPLRYAITSHASAGEVAQRAGEGSAFHGVQASVNLCDQEALDAFAVARQRGLGTIAKRSLAGRPWAGGPSGDAVHDEYRRRYAAMRPDWPFSVEDWDAFALRFVAFAPNVDCVIVGGIDAANVDRNVAAISAGPLTMAEQAAVTAAYGAPGRRWRGLV